MSKEVKGTGLKTRRYRRRIESSFDGASPGKLGRSMLRPYKDKHQGDAARRATKASTKG